MALKGIVGLTDHMEFCGVQREKSWLLSYAGGRYLPVLVVSSMHIPRYLRHTALQLRLQY